MENWWRYAGLSKGSQMVNAHQGLILWGLKVRDFEWGVLGGDTSFLERLVVECGGDGVG